MRGGSAWRWRWRELHRELGLPEWGGGDGDVRSWGERRGVSQREPVAGAS